jgi:hypothetical protein
VFCGDIVLNDGCQVEALAFQPVSFDLIHSSFSSAQLIFRKSQESSSSEESSSSSSSSD